MLGDRRGLDRHRPVRVVAAPGQPLRRADDLGRLRVAAERVHRGRRPASSSRSAVLVSNLYLAAFVHLLLAYPDGRLERRAHAPPDRGRLRARGARPAAAAAVRLRRGHAVRRLPGVGAPDPSNDDDLRDDRRRASRRCSASRSSPSCWSSCCGAGAQATPPQRRALAPLLWSGVVLLVLVAGTLGAQTPPAIGRVTDVLTLPARSSSPPSRSRSCSACCAAACRAPTRSASCCVRLGEAPGTDGAARPAGRRARRPLARARLLGRDGRWVDARRPRGRAAADGDRSAPGRRSSSRASAWARSCTTRACAPSPRSCARSPPPRAWRCENERLEAELRARLEELRARAPGSSRPACRSAGGWSATCTTAPSSGSSRSSLTLRIAQSKIHKAPEQADEMLAARAGGAHARARGAARARPRHPPGRAVRPRPAGRRRGARRALAAAGASSSRSPASGCPSRSRRPPTS